MSKFNKLERMVEPSSRRPRRVNEAVVSWRLLGGEYDNIEDFCHDLTGMTRSLKELVDGLYDASREIVDAMGNVRKTSNSRGEPMYAFDFEYLHNYMLKLFSDAETINELSSALVKLKKRSSGLRGRLWAEYQM